MDSWRIAFKRGERGPVRFRSEIGSDNGRSEVPKNPNWGLIVAWLGAVAVEIAEQFIRECPHSVTGTFAAVMESALSR